MKRFPLILILLLSMPSRSSAEWVMLPLEELVCDSDLIVVGTLSSVSEYSKNGMDYGQGMITVSATIRNTKSHWTCGGFSISMRKATTLCDSK